MLKYQSNDDQCTVILLEKVEMNPRTHLVNNLSPSVELVGRIFKQSLT